MRELRSVIEIDASPGEVWQVPTDFDAYPEWNPFIQAIEGNPKVGARPRVRIQPPGTRGVTLRPTMRSVQPTRELRWLGRLFTPGAGRRRAPARGRPWPRPSEASSR